MPGWSNYQPCDASSAPVGERRCPMTETPCRRAPEDCPYHLRNEQSSWLAYDRAQVRL